MKFQLLSKDFIRVKHPIATYILGVLNRSSQEGGVAGTDMGGAGWDRVRVDLVKILWVCV